ncbi:hypothetical protein BgiMline_001877 [Biomphalaria glabrata]|nr:hypothetical protein BgiMline_001752 [Biomphalaria glabrata]
MFTSSVQGSPLQTHLECEAIEHIPEAIEHIPEAIEHIPEAIEHIPEAIEHIPEAIEHIPVSKQTLRHFHLIKFQTKC